MENSGGLSGSRVRNKTVAFRLSDKEYEDLELRYKLCGYSTKQEYILDNILKQKVEGRANPQMLVTFRKNLLRIEELLKEDRNLNDSDADEIKRILKRMLEVLEGF